MRKPAFCICENKDADQLRKSFAVTAKRISAFVFAIRIVQFLYYLHPKFQASSHLLWLYSPVCVGPGRKPRRSVFSQRGSYYLLAKSQISRFLQVSVAEGSSWKSTWLQTLVDPSSHKMAQYCEKTGFKPMETKQVQTMLYFWTFPPFSKAMHRKSFITSSSLNIQIPI